MPQTFKLRRSPLLRAIIGFLGMLSVTSVLGGGLGMLVPQHAAAAQQVLDRGSASEAVWTVAAESDSQYPGALLRSSAATEPVAAVSSAPFESQHPEETPVEAPDSGIGSIEVGDDFSDFDDFAYHLRVIFDGAARLNRDVERGVSLGGRAFSRLEDNRGDKPPRR